MMLTFTLSLRGSTLDVRIKRLKLIPALEGLMLAHRVRHWPKINPTQVSLQM